MASLDVLVTAVALRLDLNHRWTEQCCGFSGKEPVELGVMGQAYLLSGPCPSASSSQGLAHGGGISGDGQQWGSPTPVTAPERHSVLRGMESERFWVISSYLLAPALLLS